MDRFVDISFDCLPLRSIQRFDVPLDAPIEQEEFVNRVRLAIEKHGRHNTYYLHDATCVYHLTNDPDVALLRFRFEGTVLTATDDQETLECDLDVRLDMETCEWLTEPIVEWFAETVKRAVQVEFNRFIAAGDLERTVRRLEELQAESDAQGGFLGMGL